MNTLPDVETFLDLLRHPERQPVELGLERMLELLSRLGDPHLRLPPVVHVAGTNGKGSTLAFLRTLLEAHGRQVHVYTSPHLVRFNERIVVRGREIDDERLRDCLHKVIAATGSNPATFFEAATAAAFLAFSRARADFTLLETGLGGRLDATNVVPHPTVSCITAIGMDHMEFLGPRLRDIAREKAGILRRGVPCIVAPQVPEAREELQRCAALSGAMLEWSDPEAVSENALGLAGVHQRENASNALSILRHVLADIDPSAVRRGLAGVRWPARLQRLHAHPWLSHLPAGSELWLDGGHNPQAGQRLADWARTADERPMVLVCGMMARKDAKAFLSPFHGIAGHIYGVPIPGEMLAYSAEEIAACAVACGIAAEPAEDVPQALASQQVPCRVLICGSLYLAGVVLAAQ